MRSRFHGSSATHPRPWEDLVLPQIIPDIAQKVVRRIQVAAVITTARAPSR